MKYFLKDSKTRGVFKAPYDMSRLPSAVTTSLARFSSMSDQELADRLAFVSLEASTTDHALLLLNDRVGNYSKVRVRSQFCELKSLTTALSTVICPPLCV